MSSEGLWAHSENDQGRPHLLSEHTLGVARLARDFAGKFGFGDLGYLAGLYHDLGKISPKFQDYLRDPDSKRGGDHKGIGAFLASERLQPLAFVIAGHHGGIGDTEYVKGMIKGTDLSLLQKAREIAREIAPGAEPAVPIGGEWVENRLKVEFFIRVLFSALVDADFLDTEKHFKPEKRAVRARGYDLQSLWKELEKSQGEISGKDTSLVNSERHRIYLTCLGKAENKQGFFRLTVPTGGGKTRSAMAFALKHALRHGLDRVIMAIPYTSITEQTSTVYREIFGEDYVLEHHSAAAWRSEDDERGDGLSWSRLASENWDAPIIVTTNVQLFESLLGNKPSSCRKLHNVARSVVILDEVQTLPLALLDPTLDVLRQLVERYKVTIVLCTATQPAFEVNPLFDDLAGITEIVPDTRAMFQRLSRVDYRFPEKDETWDWNRVAEEMRSAEQALAVVNTKADARALFDALDDEGALYLTTQLCGAHRRQVIAEVKRRLDEGEHCRLVSTQVVEAGVDIDFPLVLRAVGPLDRIIQSAGRCNREGELKKGRFVVFRPADGGMPPGEYQAGSRVADMLLQELGFDPDDPATVEKYFKKLLTSVKTDRDIQGYRERFNYPEVAQRYRLITENTVPVIVRYSDEVDPLIESLRSVHPKDARIVIRKLQPYIVNVNEYKLRKAEIAPAEEIFPGLYLWLGEYDPARGLVWDQPNPEELVS